MATTSLTGRPQGEISTRSGLGVFVALNTGEKIDFEIGGLPFRIAPPKPFRSQPYFTSPYKRATAQFQKDQLDTTPTVSGQSLTGWWQRTQLSFHHGAGATYYEVAEGDTVLDRCATSSGLAGSVAGQVTLSPQTTSGTLGAPKKIVMVSDYTTTKLLSLSAAGALTAISDSADLATATQTAVATSDAVAATAVCSGHTAGYVVNVNKIEKYTIGASPTTVLWTLTDAGNRFVGVWYFKSRLWAVDNTGAWYMLSLVGGSVNAATGSFASIPDFGTGFSLEDTWKATETAAEILVAAKNFVWSITVNNSGSVPVPAAPTLVGELPSNETVASLHEYLGFVVIATGYGARFGTLNSGGGLTYGPLVSSVDFSTSKGIAGTGSSVQMVGKDALLGLGLFSFDLGNFVDTLQPAWVCANVLTPTPATPVNSGAVVHPRGVVSWSSADALLWHTRDPLYSSGLYVNKEPSGSILTGFHRFDTLESKLFHSITVNATGAGGTITISKVREDGSETSLYVLDVSRARQVQVGLRESGPSNAVALKFTLARNPSNFAQGPTLLGYTLRALPAPIRQRQIQVPLMLVDTERSGAARATGRLGSAWARLSALEDMESSGGTFFFTDHRTGESGECFIDSVEFTGETAPTVNDPGFGGIIQLTIRKLA